jgi:hypothetical protein
MTSRYGKPWYTTSFPFIEPSPMTPRSPTVSACSISRLVNRLESEGSFVARGMGLSGKGPNQPSARRGVLTEGAGMGNFPGLSAFGALEGATTLAGFPLAFKALGFVGFATLTGADFFFAAAGFAFFLANADSFKTEEVDP